MSALAPYSVGKRIRFDATRIVGGAYDGHGFIAEAVMSASELTAVGFVADFRDLEPLKGYIDDHLDHKELTAVLGDASDDAIARHLHHWSAANLPERARACLSEIRVRTGRPSEQDTCAPVRFEATHRLDGLADGHPCGSEHGHSYAVTVVAGPGHPLVTEALADYVKAALDGAFLNDVLSFNPTSELLARHFGHWLHDRQPAAQEGHMAVRVSETDTTWAEYHVRTP